MDIFEYQYEQNKKNNTPLAMRMRPKNLEEFIGQEKIIGKNTPLYKAIVTDKLTSIILYGPPGTGKTTLAKIIAKTTMASFETINATTSGVKDIKAIIEKAKERISTGGNKTIAFVDEIHRFNKSQQDTLLPYVEDGTIVLIGATTENPYFEVNKALLSRSKVFTLENLDKYSVKTILKNAINKLEEEIKITEDAIDFIADISGGDARSALNTLDMALANDDITIDVIKQIASMPLGYDKNGEGHYNNISAFIKSIRGTDPDAAIYYLARMLEAGEDPKFIARRLIISASEDVGNADPRALTIATSAFDAINYIGMPEGRIILAQATTYIACAPKSNAAYLAINEAINDVRNIAIKDIPSHLKNVNPYDEEKIGYKYPHDYDGFVEQDYLPNEILGTIYYRPKKIGYEKTIKERLSLLIAEKYSKI